MERKAEPRGWADWCRPAPTLQDRENAAQNPQPPANSACSMQVKQPRTSSGAECSRDCPTPAKQPRTTCRRSLRQGQGLRQSQRNIVAANIAAEIAARSPSTQHPERVAEPLRQGQGLHKSQRRGVAAGVAAEIAARTTISQKPS